MPLHLPRAVGRGQRFFPLRFGARLHGSLEGPATVLGQLHRPLPVGAVREFVLANHPFAQLRVAETPGVDELVAVLGIEHGHLHLEVVEDGFLHALLLDQALLGVAEGRLRFGQGPLQRCNLFFLFFSSRKPGLRFKLGISPRRQPIRIIKFCHIL